LSKFHFYFIKFSLPYIPFIYRGSSKIINGIGLSSKVKLNTEEDQQQVSLVVQKLNNKIIG
jgi:hypothetical protein